MAEEYVKGRGSRMSGDSRGSSERTQSRVSFADQSGARSTRGGSSSRSLAESYDDDDDVSLARFGVRCETQTPNSLKKDESKPKFEPKKDRLKSVMSSYLK